MECSMDVEIVKKSNEMDQNFDIYFVIDNNK